MTDPPAQFKDRSDYTPGEWLTYLQSGQPAENPAYEEARRAALEAADLEADHPRRHADRGHDPIQAPLPNQEARMSTETTPAETRSPRWTGLSNDERLLLPDEATSPPAAVLAANQQAVATFGRYRPARADSFQSGGARLKAAPVLDRQADAAASASDQPLPTKRAEPAAREAFQAAQRRLQASLDAFQQSERDLSTAILTARHEWQQSQAGICHCATRRR